MGAGPNGSNYNKESASDSALSQHKKQEYAFFVLSGRAVFDVGLCQCKILEFINPRTLHMVNVVIVT